MIKKQLKIETNINFYINMSHLMYDYENFSNMIKYGRIFIQSLKMKNHY